MKFFITPLVNEISKKNLRGIRRNYSCSLRAVYLTIGKGHGKKFRIKVTRDEISNNFYYNNIFHNPTHFRDMSEKLATYRKKIALFTSRLGSSKTVGNTKKNFK